MFQKWYQTKMIRTWVFHLERNMRFYLHCPTVNLPGDSRIIIKEYYVNEKGKSSRRPAKAKTISNDREWVGEPAEDYVYQGRAVATNNKRKIVVKVGADRPARKCYVGQLCSSLPTFPGVGARG